MDKGTGGDGGKGKSVAGHDVGLGSVFNLVTHFKSLRSDDVALFAVLILNEGDVCGTVGVVLKGEHGGGCRLVTLKVDYTVFFAISAAAMTDGDAAVAVASGVFLHGLQQAAFGGYLRKLGIINYRHSTATRCGRLVMFDCHFSSLSFLHHALEEFDIL